MRKSVGSMGTALGLVLALVSALVVVFSPFVVQAEICGMETETALLAGQNIAAGSVTVSNDGENLLVTYHAVGDWLITETHLHIALTPEELPQTKKGNAIPGRFDYQSTYGGGVAEASYTIDLADWPEGTELYIAAHSVVVGGGGSETAWGAGMDFPGSDWAMYFAHTVQPCDPIPSNPGVIEFAQPAISISENGYSFTLSLVRNDGSDGIVSVTLGSAPVDGGPAATADVDYESVFTTVVFNDGETEKQIEVFVLDDPDDEPDEQFSVYIESVDGAQVGGQSEVNCTIIDDDETSEIPS